MMPSFDPSKIIDSLSDAAVTPIAFWLTLMIAAFLSGAGVLLYVTLDESFDRYMELQNHSAIRHDLAMDIVQKTVYWQQNVIVKQFQFMADNAPTKTDPQTRQKVLQFIEETAKSQKSFEESFESILESLKEHQRYLHGASK